MRPYVGLLLALGCAFATNLAFLWKQRGAVAAPEVDMRRPLAAPRACSAPSGGRSASASRSSPGSSTSRRSRWRRSRWCRRSSPAASCSWPCWPTAGSASRSAGASGRASASRRRPRLPRPDRRAQPTGSHSSYSIAGMIAFEGGMVTLGALLLLSHRVERGRATGTASCSGPRRGSCSASPTSRSRRSPARCRATCCRSSVRGRCVAVARLGRRLLRLGARPSARRGRLGDRAHLRGRQRLGDPRRDHRLRRPDRRRRARDRRAQRAPSRW